MCFGTNSFQALVIIRNVLARQEKLIKFTVNALNIYGLRLLAFGESHCKSINGIYLKILQRGPSYAQTMNLIRNLLVVSLWICALPLISWNISCDRRPPPYAS